MNITRSEGIDNDIMYICTPNFKFLQIIQYSFNRGGEECVSKDIIHSVFYSDVIY